VGRIAGRRCSTSPTRGPRRQRARIARRCSTQARIRTGFLWRACRAVHRADRRPGPRGGRRSAAPRRPRLARLLLDASADPEHAGDLQPPLQAGRRVAGAAARFASGAATGSLARARPAHPARARTPRMR
jgi:hypothetical protein